MWILFSLQAAVTSNGVGGGVVELDKNGSVVMGGEEHGPQESNATSSEDLDSLQALRSISQVRFAAPCVWTSPTVCPAQHLPCSFKQQALAYEVVVHSECSQADVRGASQHQTASLRS